MKLLSGSVILLATLLTASCVEDDVATATPCTGCAPEAICIGLPGGGQGCRCREGFAGDGTICFDVDECATENGGCAPDATCVNENGSFTCACKAGYAGTGKDCSDIDECAVANGGCDAHADCNNDPGSFNCSCITGYVGDGKHCTLDPGCDVVALGCATVGGTCRRTSSGDECLCKPGYRGNGNACAEIDECTEGSDNCHANAKCTNFPGTFECRCNQGYAGNGVVCEDINECSQNAGGCTGGSTCVNLPGSFKCQCAANFQYSGGRCVPTDPCATNNGGCDSAHGLCGWNGTVRTCECEAGFTGDGFACTDVTEALFVDTLFNVDYALGSTAPRCRGARYNQQWLTNNWRVAKTGTNTYAGSYTDAHVTIDVDLVATDLVHRQFSGTVATTWAFTDSCFTEGISFAFSTTAGDLAHPRGTALPLTISGTPKSWFFDESANLDASGATVTYSGSVKLRFPGDP